MFNADSNLMEKWAPVLEHDAELVGARLDRLHRGDLAHRRVEPGDDGLRHRRHHRAPSDWTLAGGAQPAQHRRCDRYRCHSGWPTAGAHQPQHQRQQRGDQGGRHPPGLGGQLPAAAQPLQRRALRRHQPD